jgi:transposase
VYRWKKREDCPAHQVEREEQTERRERWEQAKALRLRGLSQREIADRLAVGVRTVQRWQAQEEYQGYQHRRKRRSIFDPYAAYILSRWQQGERSVSLLWQEIREQGFSGSIQTLYRYVRALRQDAASLPAPTVLDRVSAQKALWLIVGSEETLKADERRDLQELCQASQELATLHTLAQSFGQIIRKREAPQLDPWMKQVQESSFRRITRFVSGLQRDKEEVLAALPSVHSNGQVEGFVNKLKLIKRQGYGRASFPLLGQRMLHALEYSHSSSCSERKERASWRRFTKDDTGGQVTVHACNSTHASAEPPSGRAVQTRW